MVWVQKAAGQVVEWVVCAPTLCLLSGRAAASPGPSALEINLSLEAGRPPALRHGLGEYKSIRRTLYFTGGETEAGRVQFLVQVSVQVKLAT